jgi:hypothetical protein
MRVSQRIRPCRIPLAAAALFSGLVAGPLLPHNAAAAISLCRTDPIVRLSNGVVVDLTATISTSGVNVQQIVYMLHAPAGTRVLSVLYTGGDLAGRERVQFFADTAATTYKSVTTVSTSVSAVPVTASMRVSSVGSGTASGYSGQALTVNVSHS